MVFEWSFSSYQGLLIVLWWSYLLPIASVITYHKLQGWKQCRCIILQLKKSQVWHGSPCSENQNVGRAVFLSEHSGGESVFLPFPASRGCLHSLACGPFFHLQSQQSHHPDLWFHCVTPPLTLTRLPLLFTYKAPCDDVSLTWIIQGILQILNAITSAKSLLTHICRSWRLEHRHLWGGIVLPITGLVITV